MKNFVQSDDTITVTAPRDLSSGDGVLVGTLFGVAVTDALSGELVPIATKDCFTLDKATGEAWTEGQAIYWHDGTVKHCTTTSSANTKIGTAILPGSGSMPGTNDTTGLVRLNGHTG